MKRVFFALISLCILISCKSNTKKTSQESDQPAKLMAEFEPIIHGAWAKISYVDKVIKTKSPLAAIDQAQGITALLFDRNTIQGDSLLVVAGWENHDSNEITLKFKRGTHEHSLLFGAGELQYAIVNKDTLLTIYLPDNKTHNIQATVYKRSPVKNDDIASGLAYFINKGLIAGNYIIKDKPGNIINFLAPGEINSFLNFTSYSINIDLNSDAMDNLDQIYLYYQKGYKSYSFKVNADTLKLYETRPNADSTLLILGKLKYTLIRQE
jgi:hypothetical protein